MQDVPCPTLSREIELEQQDALFASAKPPQVLVGTPQRVADLCRMPRTRPVLRFVRTVVLDEVDLMLPPLPAGAASPQGGGGGGTPGGGGVAPTHGGMDGAGAGPNGQLHRIDRPE